MWLNGTFKHDDMLIELLPYYKKEITFLFKVKALFNVLLNKLFNKKSIV